MAHADLIDVGGESTRPGATEVAEETEIARVVPVVAELRADQPGIVGRIDTRALGELVVDLGGGICCTASVYPE